MGCNCKKPGGSLPPAKPKDQSKISSKYNKKNEK